MGTKRGKTQRTAGEENTSRVGAAQWTARRRGWHKQMGSSKDCMGGEGWHELWRVSPKKDGGGGERKDSPKDSSGVVG